MTPKSRKPQNKKLPARWRYKHGAYYYRPAPGSMASWDGKTEFRLGKTLTEAYQVWSKRINENEAQTINTMAALMDRYAAEVVPTKARKTQEGNLTSIRKLRPVFGHLPVKVVRPSHVNQYKYNATKAYGAKTTNHDLEVLSHMLTMAVEWGIVERNEIKGQVRKNKINPRDRLVEDWELSEAMKVADQKLGLYIDLKYMTGLRRGDLLSLKVEDIRPDGIHVQPRKTAHSSGKRLIIEMTPDLKSVIDEILKIPPRRIGATHLFLTRDGKPYIKEDGSCNAFDSLWDRFMKRAIRETGLVERFQERDIRAKNASDSDSLIEASERLGHASTDITRRVYRRKPDKVKPLKRILRK